MKMTRRRRGGISKKDIGLAELLYGKIRTRYIYLFLDGGKV